LHLNRSVAQTVTTSTMNGTVFVASRAVQPSGQVKLVQPQKTTSKSSDSSKNSSKTRRLRSGDSSSTTSVDAPSTTVPPMSLASPPSSPASLGTGAISTPTSSGGELTPGLWTPIHSPSENWHIRSDSRTSCNRQRRWSWSNTPSGHKHIRYTLQRRWHSDSEVSNANGSPKCDRSIKNQNLEKSRNSVNDGSPMFGMTPPPIPKRSAPPPIPPRPSERTKQYTRPPPLDLRALSNGNGTKTPNSNSGRIQSQSVTSPSTFSTTTNGSATRATMLKKSKEILASISSIEDNESGDTRPKGASMRNPFPVKRQTTLIERGKRLGLYS